jgi:hypothetical protein
MTQRMVILAIETDDSMAHPERWNWAELIDSPYPVSVLGACDLADEPDDAEVERVRAAAQSFCDLVTP